MRRADNVLRVRASVAVAAGAILPFIPALGGWFAADDFLFLEQFASGAFNWTAVATWQEAPTSFYRPLPFASLLAEWQLWHLRAMPFHATNLSLHGFAAALMFFIARQLVSGPHATSAAAIGTLFAFAHPRRTEAVAWVSCRPDLLAAVLALTATALLLRWRETRSDLTLGGVAAAVLLALLSKESVALMPVVLVLFALDVARSRGERMRQMVAPAAVVAVALAIGLVMRRGALGVWLGGYPTDGFPAPHPAVSAVQFLTYTIIPAVPIPQEVMLRRSTALAVGAVLAAVAIAGAILVWRRRDDPAARLGVLWFVASIVPVLRFWISLTTTQNDRLTYLPSIGLGLIVAGSLARAAHGVRTGAAVIVVLLAVDASLTADHWRVAGRTTWKIISELAAVSTVERDVPLYVAAMPDSYRGAYVLRNGVREAVALTGGVRTDLLTPLSLYFLANASELPVEVTRVDQRVLVHGRQGPEVIVPPHFATDRASASGPQLDTLGRLDKFGRRPYVEFTIHRPGDIYVAGPHGVTRVD